MGNVLAPAMVDVPPGRVTLSDRRTQQFWDVDVDGFQLGRTPVTQQLWAEVTGHRPSTAVGDLLPVECVSWMDAVHFCDALSVAEGLRPAYGRDGQAADGADVMWDASVDGYRLPTEAEWEHGCRAGTTGPRYGDLDEIAWHRENSGGCSREVGGLRPNAWGLHDMLGGVWEWCWDFYDPDVYGSYRVLRGGGWFDERWSCRASVRRRSHPNFRIDDVGLRLARSSSGSAAR
jgi:formylglycine-generating enzyme required for sulfatase activity